MRRSSLAAFAGLLLYGCASGVPVDRQTVVTGARFNNVQGEASFIVRTVLPAEARAERRELVGARCTALSSLYKAEFVTPNRLVVPNFGPQSPEITVTCAAGELSGRATARIVTHWEGPPYPGWGWGPGWGPAWGAGWDPWYPGWGWYGSRFPVSDYPDLLVPLY
jgi:hypothetical protein